MRLLKMESLPTDFFIKSRSKLKELLLPASAVIISSNRAMPRNADQSYHYRQSSDMYYLTGIRQELCTLVISADRSAGEFREILYIPESDKKTVTWDGPRMTAGEAKHVSGISDVRHTKYLLRDLHELLSGCQADYYGT